MIGSVRHAALAAIAATALIFCTPAGSLAQGKPYRTIILFGDTQYIVRSDQQPAGLEAFEDMIDWVIANVDAENIDLVAQLGDATDRRSKRDPTDAETLQQWANFNSQWKRLDGIVPYAIVRGNHDNKVLFSQHYGSAHFLTEDSQGVRKFPHYEQTFDPLNRDLAHIWKVDIGAQPVVVVGLPWNATQDELDWAQSRLQFDYNGLPAILLTHHLHATSPPVRGLIEPNAHQIFLTAEGHTTDDHLKKTVEVVAGRPVLETLQNWQWPNPSVQIGGAFDGYMARVRIWSLSDPQEIAVDSFTPIPDPGNPEATPDPDDPTLLLDVQEGRTSLAAVPFGINKMAADNLDGDGYSPAIDLCPGTYDPLQEDTDLDGADGVGDLCDNCPVDFNPDQHDRDGDLVGDVCENCPLVYNPSQLDTDGDLRGNACDRNSDGDHRIDRVDNCPEYRSSDRTDSNGDGIGNVCQCGDANEDGWIDWYDWGRLWNCRRGTAQCDATIADTNNDGVLNGRDLWNVAHREWALTFICARRPVHDSDGDGVSHLDDPCPSYPNTAPVNGGSGSEPNADSNGDRIPNECQCGDTDESGLLTFMDSFNLVSCVADPACAAGPANLDLWDTDNDGFLAQSDADKILRTSASRAEYLNTCLRRPEGTPPP